MGVWRQIEFSVNDRIAVRSDQPDTQRKRPTALIESGNY